MGDPTKERQRGDNPAAKRNTVYDVRSNQILGV
jgi:hypothetical protein